MPMVVLVTIHLWRWLSSPVPLDDGKYDAVNALDALLSLHQSANVTATPAPGGSVGGCSLLGAGGASLKFRQTRAYVSWCAPSLPLSDDQTKKW